MMKLSGSLQLLVLLLWRGKSASIIHVHLGGMGRGRNRMQIVTEPPGGVSWSERARVPHREAKRRLVGVPLALCFLHETLNPLFCSPAGTIFISYSGCRENLHTYTLRSIYLYEGPLLNVQWVFLYIRRVFPTAIQFTG